jgi:hypothetical protein
MDAKMDAMLYEIVNTANLPTERTFHLCLTLIRLFGEDKDTQRAEGLLERVSHLNDFTLNNGQKEALCKEVDTLLYEYMD